MSAPAVPPRPYKYQFYKDIHSKDKQSTDSQSSNFKDTPQLQKYSTGVEKICNYQSPNSMNNANSNDMDNENELIRSALESLNINKDHGSKDFKVKISQETMRKCTMANVFFLDHYCDLMLYIAQRKLRLQSFRNDISAKQYELSHFEIERQWKLYCGKERAYLRKRRTRLKVSSFRIHSQVGQGGYGEVVLWILSKKGK
ncbi:hypothetical protein HK098_002889 [Nowakowskiella sp. JEL0407]|nr:hypothetical protein HK098_002889 [Nowakowskiella sp. JEL0407]